VSRARAIHLAVVALLLVAVYGSGIERVKFHKDESAWIGTSYYLEAFLGEPVNRIRPELPDPVWTATYETLTQPPLARYVMGVGRRLGGYTITELNRPWDFRQSLDANAASGHMPSENLLLWSRRPMVLLSVVSGLLLFSLVTRCAGLVAGYTFAILFAFNPYFLETLRRAMGDATLMVFAVAVLVATERGLEAWRRAGAGDPSKRAGLAPAAWAILAALLCGLAGASKLNGLVAAGGVAVVAALAIIRGSKSRPQGPRLGTAIVAAEVILATAAIAFVAPNPYLYANPPLHTKLMFEHRADEMRRQRDLVPETRLNGVVDRAQAAARRVLILQAVLRFPGAWLINAGLTLAGLVVLARRARHELADRAPGPALAILVVGASLVFPAVLTPLNWDRYYLFPVVFANICIAVGVAVGVKFGRTVAGSRFSRHRTAGA